MPAGDLRTEEGVCCVMLGSAKGRGLGRQGGGQVLGREQQPHISPSGRAQCPPQAPAERAVRVLLHLSL